MNRYRARFVIGAFGAWTLSALSSSGCDLLTVRSYHEPEVGNGGAGGAAGGGGAGGSVIPVCGNSMLEQGEACDDGNTFDGDGCSATCTVEVCWHCLNGTTCTPLLVNSACGDGTEVCDGAGVCGLCVPIAKASPGYKNCGGSACSVAGDCASGVCVYGTCRSAIGELCSDPVECSSNACFGAKPTACRPCSSDAQCFKSGQCDAATGVCYGALLDPCAPALGLPCASGLGCSSGLLCKGMDGMGCNANSQCLSNLCKAGLCASCVSGAECNNQACNAGSCPPAYLPNGAYCANPLDCASAICTGFPPKCG